MKKYNIKKLSLAIAALCLAAVSFSIGCKLLKSSDSPLANTQTSSPVMTVSAIDLYNEYKKDQTSADKKYKDKIVQVSGEIFLATEKSMTGEPVASFKADGKDGVLSKFPEAQRDSVGKLKAGQMATFTCEVKGAILMKSFYGVELQNCAVN